MAESVERPAYKQKTLSELYDELCPMYMSMGMRYEEFWDGPAEMIIAYRRSYERQRRQMNFNAWLIGFYVQEAFAVVYHNAWAKNSKSAISYPTKPHPLTEEDARREKEEEQRLRMEKLFSYVANKVKIQQKEAQENG